MRDWYSQAELDELLAAGKSTARLGYAERASAAPNVEFRVGSHRLEGVTSVFDVILSRHAPLQLHAVAEHLKAGGYFTGIDGSAALTSEATLNQILAGHVDDRGFVTNEHRYLAISPARA